ncbi:hypothetical protein DZB84_21120 [Bacillus sp. HNG]|uniref:hypothetical protein n=1 Tax=Bacillus sp. HNG TaxID=2293325 RepID=UPI000E2F1F7C|nr:hypothetical protein [Bacillus sp. HNG]RFB11430.1 hypothetical protein DZB84_21120 [Bacillus sp. HNG]
MRFLIAVPLIIIGAFLIGLTNNDMDVMGKAMIKIIGWGSFFVGILICGRKKKEKKDHLKRQVL